MDTVNKYCAKCGDLLGSSYFKSLDNFLIVKYFDEQDGSDNMFCSRDCFCEALSCEEVSHVGHSKP